MRATLSRNGRKTTTRVARIRRSTTRHRRPLPPNSPQQAITLRSVMAPRAGLLLTPPERAYSCRDSNPRWGILQWQVILYHMDEPVRLLEQISDHADNVFIWTHCIPDDGYSDEEPWTRTLVRIEDREVRGKRTPLGDRQ